MGSGKTTSIFKYFPQYKYIIFVSTRITFTQSIGAKYQLYSYLQAQEDGVPMAFSEEHP